MLPDLAALTARTKLPGAHVSQALGVSRSTWSHWERGITPIPRHHLPAIAHVLGVAVPELITSGSATPSCTAR
ncbi:helix-turn-helix transcriptional regulator [Modestobacter sp. Leaf380]|uniref:helix-turn-helix domain-containing protein n=1 Tax=Modestobacter sp. Leaf380 TaxID=1736356 RepID=UPI00138F7F8D